MNENIHFQSAIVQFEKGSGTIGCETKHAVVFRCSLGAEACVGRCQTSCRGGDICACPETPSRGRY